MTLAPTPPPQEKIELEDLPESAQEKLRSEWRRAEELAEVQRRRVHERWVRTLVEGALVLFLAEWIYYGFRWIDLIIVPLVGIGVGAVWHHAQTERVTSALVAVLGFWVVRLGCGVGFLFYGFLASLLVFALSLAVVWPRTAERLGA